MLARVLTIAAVILTSFYVQPSQAQTNDQEELLDRALITFNTMRRDENVGPSLNNLLPDAKALIIVPSLLKGGLILGGEGGSGVLFARLEDGRWSAPSFVFMGGASVGLQFGGSLSEVIMTVMTDQGLNAVLVNKFKLGADASAAIGPVGGRVGAATTSAAGADIFKYAMSDGLFVGAAFEGAVIARRDEWDHALYGQSLTARQIINDLDLNPPQAVGLRQALAAAS